MTREDYLKKNWKSYPAVPEDVIAWGRLIDWNPESRRITLKRQDQNHALIVEPREFQMEWARLGDWLAVETNLDLKLLAPCLNGEFIDSTKRLRLLQWSSFLQSVRRFFLEHDFLEVPTPSLVVCPGTEPSLDVFETHYKRGRDERTLYLPTSPELHLKKALAQGLDPLFEIKSCFRNGEVTETHQPEFTMIEWYRAGAHLTILQEDVVTLVDYLSRQTQNFRRPRQVQSFKVAQLFLKFTGAFMTPHSTREDYLALAQSLGLRTRLDDSIDDLYFLIFTEKIEPQLPREDLIFVTDWPPFQAALARLNSSGWGDRFEVYWQGLELANAFHELNDPEIQRQRFDEDRQKKQAMSKPLVPLDEDFLRALDSGMPPASGIALGLERLFMALSGETQIANLKVFPF